MFFVLSKLLVFLTRPISWVFFLLLYAAFGKKEKWKRRCLITGLIVFFVFSNKWLFNQAVKVWEVDTQTMETIESPYDVGILLGGYSNYFIYPRTDRHNFNDRANRFNNALELYFKGKIRKILLTGGSGSLLNKTPGEAAGTRQYLLALGVPEEDIIIENESRNTWENALFSKRLIDERYPGASCLLITSAWHMRRSRGCFRKAGMKTDYFSVDFLGEKGRFSVEHLLLPNAQAFSYWEFLIKEWIGYIAYGIKGYL